MNIQVEAVASACPKALLFTLRFNPFVAAKKASETTLTAAAVSAPANPKAPTDCSTPSFPAPD